MIYCHERSGITEIEFHALTWSVKHLSLLFLAYDCDICTCILQEEILINYVDFTYNYSQMLVTDLDNPIINKSKKEKWTNIFEIFKLFRNEGHKTRDKRPCWFCYMNRINLSHFCYCMLGCAYVTQTINA